jgi:hypothetical protein
MNDETTLGIYALSVPVMSCPGKGMRPSFLRIGLGAMYRKECPVITFPESSARLGM